MDQHVPLSARPLDLIYFTFFLCHIPASLLMDFQGLLYPNTYFPWIPEWYIEFSGDPLIGGLLRREEGLVWFKCFLVLELLFQFPVFLLGMRGLWKGSRSIYILILFYGASTATTTLPCIFHVIGSDALATGQMWMLLSSYIPFFLLPFGMAVDMAFRIYGIMEKGSVDKKRE
ncbi:transmembrane protein 6/97 [Armillaria borealis]|uniref:Efficient mitochondria targeting-associated protein 19 n=1 Tax=Armillaria borealis TaxID=47425 RepID=A0AA39JQG1_9AGAR|nr:transmembrane protein 6/97 [Armillaria borealis]